MAFELDLEVEFVYVFDAGLGQAHRAALILPVERASGGPFQVGGADVCGFPKLLTSLSVEMQSWKTLSEEEIRCCSFGVELLQVSKSVPNLLCACQYGGALRT